MGVPGIYNAAAYHKHHAPTLGARAYTPSRNFLPKFSALGSGQQPLRIPSPIQSPQVQWPQHIGTVGFGGIFAGNMISQPLISASGLPYLGT